MSGDEFKPGWAEQFGQEMANENEPYRRSRRLKPRPFEHTMAERLDAGRRASVKAVRSQRLDRVLGPLKED